MASYLDLDAWPRRAQFEFFKELAEPFWDVCVEVDVTALREICRARGGPSFFEASCFLSLRAANAVPNLRYRLRRGAEPEQDRVLEHGVIRGSCTVLRPDETFGFSYFDYHQDFAAFARGARRAMDAAAASAGLSESGGDDLIYYSVLPWISFTSFRHARAADRNDSVPRLVFGKYHQEQGRWRMPASLSVHHALADGLHAGRFYENFQADLDAAAELIPASG